MAKKKLNDPGKIRQILVEKKRAIIEKMLDFTLADNKYEEQKRLLEDIDASIKKIDKL